MSCLLWLLLTPVLLFFVLQRVLPHPMSRWLLGLERKRAGLRAGTLKLGEQQVSYLEGGLRTGETIVLLHGIGASKDHFTRVALLLAPRYRIISVDLPGFGDSSRDAPTGWEVPAQAERVKQIADALSLPRFHLGGSSMGGFIAMHLAAKHPTRVQSLWLLDPAGVPGAKLSPMLLAYQRNGRSALFARTVEELDDVFGWVFARVPWVPWSVKRVTAERAVADEELHQKIFKVLYDSKTIEALAPQIQAPALIVWGQSDRILDVSGGELLRHLLPNAQLELMDGVGHLPMLEAPAKCAARYLEFLKTISTA